MSPEIADCRGTKPTTDLFSLGISGVALLSGKRNGINRGQYLFNPNTKTGQHLIQMCGERYDWNDKERLTNRLLKQFPEDRTTVMQVVEFVFRCMQKDHIKRPQTLEEQQQILNDTGNLSEV